MNILFVMRHAGYVRNFEWALRLLAERGHRVHVAFDEPSRAWMLEPAAVLAGLADRYPNVSHGAALGRDLDPWSILARRLRLAIDYLRYLEPGYRDARKLRARAGRRAPRIVRRLAGWPVVRAPLGLALLRRGLQVIEQAVSDARASARFIGRHRPDILLLTPLVELGSPQTDYVRGAKARGVRTGLCVASWDNLTNKGLIRDVPDLIMVWNDAMKREAVELHGVLAERVVVTGAVPYDHWFEWRPSTSREEFCGRVGLRPDRPFVLYLCSSPFIAPEEAGFVGGWIRELRERGGPRLRDAGVLVRPHPINAAQWRDVDLSEPGRVAVWPRVGSDPVDAQSRSDYYDSIYHSVAVVGVNTSAQIESAIVGRPVYTLLAREFRDTQGGTLHFGHLAQAEGGLLRVAETFEEHAAQLAEALVADARADERTRQFVEAFVRPWGLDVAATPRLVEAIEVACAAPAPRPRPRPRWAALLHLLLTPLVYGGHRGQQ
ncbi:MAG: hypothetical protein H0V51_02345, partial [Chloroflexi bacterium]|nr:hypothetical protein [Chloroflexota bacterium]